jgi:hypothetical protein
MNGAPVEAHLGRTVDEMIPGIFPIVEPNLHRALNGETILKVEAPKPAKKARPRRPKNPVVLSTGF